MDVVVWLAPKEVDPGAFGNGSWVYAAIGGSSTRKPSSKRPPVPASYHPEIDIIAEHSGGSQSVPHRQT
jgi:hypothetical protein